ncbi:MAG: DUF72 domain-containing protein, partial [Caldilineaceae bacterium]|nr:DUF72 domain-containing protein [Caldilineaceae bacterium]
GVPRPSTLISWVESVPSGFTFCLKFPRAITHEKRLVDCKPDTLIFLDVLRSLGEAAAPGLIQFPPDFSRSRYGKRLADYLDWLAGQLDTIRVGIEVRSPDLMTPAFATFLAERGMAYVLVDREQTPDAYPCWEELVTAGTAPSFALLRWIGDDQNGPQGNDQLVAPRDTQLDAWAQQLSRLHQAGIEIYGYMHNPYEGHSPASVRRLQERLAPVIPLPSWPPVGTKIPKLAEDQPGQLTLF